MTIKGNFKKLVPAIAGSSALALSAAATSMPVFASSGGDATVTTAMTTAVTSIASDALSGLASIIPVAAPIMGGLIIIMVGIRTFKKFTKG